MSRKPVTENTEEILSSFKKLKKEITQKGTLRGLDKWLVHDLEKLKKRLLADVKQEQTETAQQPPRNNKPEVINNTAAVERVTTEDKIVQEITGIKPADYNKNKETTDYYQNSSGPSLLIAQRSKNSNSASRITLRMPIADGETVESQYQRAREFFKDLIIGVKDQTGNIDYNMATENIADDVKIKCSKYKGADDFNEFGGLSPSERFDKDRENKGYAEWTIPQEVVDRVVQSGVNLNTIAEAILNNDIDDARNYLRTKANTPGDKLQEINQTLNNFENNENLSPEASNINTVVNMINTLSIRPVRSESMVKYEVIASIDQGITAANLTTLERELSMWKVSNADRWVKKLLKKIIRIIKQYFEVR